MATTPPSQFPGQGRWSNGKHPFRTLVGSALSNERYGSNAVTAALLSQDSFWTARNSVQITNLGGASSAASTANITRAVAADVAVGDLVLVCVVADNAGASGVSAITSVDDSPGHTYSRVVAVNRTSGTANDGISVEWWQTTATVAMTTAVDAIFASFSPNVTSKAIFCLAATGAARSVRLSGGTSGSGTSVSMSVPASQYLADGSYLCVGLGVESADSLTVDSDTLSGVWDTIGPYYGVNIANTGVSATSVSGMKAIKTVVGSDAQSFDSSWATSTDYAAAYIVVTPDYDKSIVVKSTVVPDSRVLLSADRSGVSTTSGAANPTSLITRDGSVLSSASGGVDGRGEATVVTTITVTVDSVQTNAAAHATTVATPTPSVVSTAAGAGEMLTDTTRTALSLAVAEAVSAAMALATRTHDVVAIESLGGTATTVGAPTSSVVSMGSVGPELTVPVAHDPSGVISVGSGTSPSAMLTTQSLGTPPLGVGGGAVSATSRSQSVTSTVSAAATSIVTAALLRAIISILPGAPTPSTLVAVSPSINPFGHIAGEVTSATSITPSVAAIADGASAGVGEVTRTTAGIGVATVGTEPLILVTRTTAATSVASSAPTGTSTADVVLITIVTADTVPSTSGVIGQAITTRNASIESVLSGAHWVTLMPSRNSTTVVEAPVSSAVEGTATVAIDTKPHTTIGTTTTAPSSHMDIHGDSKASASLTSMAATVIDLRALVLAVVANNVISAVQGEWLVEAVASGALAGETLASVLYILFRGWGIPVRR